MKVRASSLVPGDVINTEPIFDYFEENDLEFNEADKIASKFECQVVESIEVIWAGTVASIITTASEFFNLPVDHEIDVVAQGETED